MNIRPRSSPHQGVDKDAQRQVEEKLNMHNIIVLDEVLDVFSSM